MHDTPTIVTVLQDLVKECHDNSRAHGFWTGAENDNEPTKIALMHSELSELLEAFRKGDPPCEKQIDIQESNDPNDVRRITSREEEVADIAIRLCDYCGRYNINLGLIILAKMAYNSKRSHMHGGKKV